MTVSNLKLDDVFSDVFGKSSRSIIQHILDHPGPQFDVAPFVGRRCKHPVEEIQAAVDGAVSREQAAKLKECLLHIDQLNEHREHIETEILRLAEPYPHQLELIRTVCQRQSKIVRKRRTNFVAFRRGRGNKFSIQRVQSMALSLTLGNLPGRRLTRYSMEDRCSSFTTSMRFSSPR